MKVHVVMYYHCGDCGQIKGVYTDPEAAEQEADRLRTKLLVTFPEEIDVEEHEVS